MWSRRGHGGRRPPRRQVPSSTLRLRMRALRNAAAGAPPRSFGFPRTTIVSAGGGDNMMGAIGTGNVVPGAVTASLGTSGTIYAVPRAPRRSTPGARSRAFSLLDCGGWPAAPLHHERHASSTERIRALFGWSLAELEHAAASARPPDSDRLTLLPYLDGERTPATFPDGTRASAFGFNAHDALAQGLPGQRRADRGRDLRDELQACACARSKVKARGGSA